MYVCIYIHYIYILYIYIYNILYIYVLMYMQEDLCERGIGNPAFHCLINRRCVQYFWRSPSGGAPGTLGRKLGFNRFNLRKRQVFPIRMVYKSYMGMGQNPVPLVNLKIAGKWMFIPLKIVLIGIDPYPYYYNRTNPCKKDMEIRRKHGEEQDRPSDFPLYAMFFFMTSRRATEIMV